MTVSSNALGRFESGLSSVQRKLRFREKHEIAFLEEFLGMFRHAEVPLEILKHMHTFGDATRKQVCQSLIPEVQGGGGLSAGMKGWFSPMVIEATRVGQSSGKLYDVLHRTTAALKMQRSSMSSSLVLLIYPALLTLGYSMLSVKLKDGAIATVLSFRNVTYESLSPNLKFVYNYATFIENYWVAVLMCILACCIGIYWTLANYVGPMRSTLDNLPIFKQYRFLTGAKLMRMYAILKEINVPEAKIFRTLRQYSNPYYKLHLTKMTRRLEAGSRDSIATVLDTGLISRANIARLALLSGYNQDYAKVLGSCAEVVVEGTAKNLKTFARLIAAVWMLLVGTALAVSMLGVMNIQQVVGV